MPPPEPDPLARALGRIPSGLYIVTTLVDGQPQGFLASFVMQASLAPPIVSVSVGRDRPILAELRRSGRFAVSILDADSKKSMAAFTRRLGAGESPFDRLQVATTPAGLPVLAEALAWFECRLASEHATGDSVIVFGEVVAGSLTREGEPHVHVRRNGLSY
ncbi:MAG: flavin reductase family protein [Planctomycetes bacterium]|nr:flavin reductase family protein [Planctomycetota bacterium]